MKYCVLIIDGAAGLPILGQGKTCLELAATPNLDAMAAQGTLGLARTVPAGMEPSSACACMSVLGYDPRIYYKGRATIEARSMGIPVEEGEVVFRCNLVAVRDGKMWDYSAGRISTAESSELVAALNQSLGNAGVSFYPGVSYRHLCKLKGHEEAIQAVCTPPHDIPNQEIAGYLPQGTGSDILRDLMARSEAVLRDHPVNRDRVARGEIPATTIWLFWGTGKVPEMPPFPQVYHLKGALTSGVDLLRGLAQMASLTVLDIPGVTDGSDNDYRAQTEGALASLAQHDLAVIHIEAPDEAAHAGSASEKIDTLQRIDDEVVRLLRNWQADALRVLVMPDHPTPVQTRTHSGEPVPFLLWGPGFAASGAAGFSEKEAKKTGLFLEEGYTIMGRLVEKDRE